MIVTHWGIMVLLYISGLLVGFGAGGLFQMRRGQWKI